MVERKQETKTEEAKPAEATAPVSIQEVEINMQLLNNKLNYIINLIEK